VDADRERRGRRSRRWHDGGVADDVVRTTLLEQGLPPLLTTAVAVRRITLQPGVRGGAHRHNGPVFGSIERGSVVLQVEGGTEQVLRAGDAFYEPADTVITRWDATSEGVEFLGYYLLTEGQAPEIVPVPSLDAGDGGRPGADAE
jgi:quercetin dioxygenase-like cupin family protein